MNLRSSYYNIVKYFVVNDRKNIILNVEIKNYIFNKYSKNWNTKNIYSLIKLYLYFYGKEQIKHITLKCWEQTMYFIYFFSFIGSTFSIKPSPIVAN